MAACLYIAGAFGCTFAGDYVTLFIFWELMSVSSTFLVWLRRVPASTRAGMRYFLFHVLGGLFLLAGLLLRYQATGTFAFEAADPAAARLWDILIMLGFCVNAAVIPLHAWLPDAYPEATVTGAVFMSAFTTKTAVYVLLRGFAGFEILAVMGTLMTLYGVIYATIENNARRILAYHIVSQVGYMVAGVGVGTAMTINGACAHAYAHILYKGLLFMGAGALLYAAGTAKLTELGGLFRRLPWVFVWYMVAAVSISGFPLFSGFVSKTMTITGAAEAHHTWLALGMEVAAVGTFLSVGIKLPYFAWFGRPDPGMALKPIPRNMYAAMAIAGFLCFFIGVQPGVPLPAAALSGRVRPLHGLARAADPAAAGVYGAGVLPAAAQARPRGQDQPRFRLFLPAGRTGRAGARPAAGRAARQLVERVLRPRRPAGDDEARRRQRLVRPGRHRRGGGRDGRQRAPGRAEPPPWPRPGSCRTTWRRPSFSG